MEHFAPKCPQCHEDLPCETLRGVGVLSWEKKKTLFGKPDVNLEEEAELSSF